MMNKLDILLKYLQNNSNEGYTSSKVLAEILNVSDRTVRNYIKNINENNNNIIQSSRKGYRLKEGFFRKSISNTHHPENRRFYILRQLIKLESQGLNLFDLSEELFVSDATIRSDMDELSQLVKKHGLQIIQNNYQYKLKGSDKSPKSLMLDLIDYSRPIQSSLEEELQVILSNISLKELMKISKKCFEKYNFHPNTYFVKNFILHLAIAIDRASEGNQLDESFYSDLNDNSNQKRIIEEISECIENKYHIQLSKAEKHELALLFDGQANFNEALITNSQSLKIYRSLEHGLNEISNVYIINFNDEGFKKRLFIHIQNLYNRTMQKKYMRNLSVLNIRIKYPIIFDVAVYLASILSDDLRININDDEIAFLALHIGAYLHNYPEENKEIKTIIITPSYFSMQNDIKKIVEKHFKDTLNIIGIYEDISEVPSFISLTLIITTQKNSIDNLSIIDAEIVTIREFIGMRDINLIGKTIDKIKHRRYINFIEENIPRMIADGFFVQLNESTSKNDIMENISSAFQEKEYVKFDYLEKLRERERLSATSYPSGIALPHTMKYEGLKTGFMILIPKDQIKWGDNDVKLIIGISVDKKESDIFNQIFPRIIELVAEPYNVNYLAGSKNRDIFINRLIELMGSESFYME